MGLSVDLISQFAKITNDKSKQSKETVAYGTAVKYDNVIYVKLDGSDILTPVNTAVDVKEGDVNPDGTIEDGERVIVTIRNHTATATGNTTSPAARIDTVIDINTKIDGVDAKVDDQGNSITAMNNNIVAIDNNITAINNDITAINNNVTAVGNNITAVGNNVTAMNNNITAINNDIEIYNSSFKIENDIVTGIKGIDGVEWINAGTITAINGNITNLDAKYAEIDKLVAGKATIGDLKAVNAEIDNLYANKANITDLSAATADVVNLKADVGYINELMFDSASGKSIQTSFSNAVIMQVGSAMIKSAMIDSISASKIAAGEINTNNVTVVSEDGKMKIADETILIVDDNNTPRVQIGKDASGDYSINVWNANGDLMFSEGGITDKAINQPIIRNDMVSDTANISAAKLDISSLFTEINQNGTNTIKSNKIYLDDKSQTLNVAFEEMTTNVGDITKTVSSQGTALSAVQGQISSKVWEQDITAATDTMNTKYSELTQTVGGINATVGSHTTKFSDINREIEYVKNNYATLAVTDEKIATQVKSFISVTNGLTNRVSAAESSISQNAEDIALKVSQSDYDALSGRVSAAESSISQNAEDIALKVSQSDYDTLSGRVSAAESSITQNAGNITLKVNAEDYENGISAVNDDLANNYTTTTDLEENYVKSGDYAEFKAYAEAALSVTQNSIDGYVTETNSRIDIIDGDLQEKFNTITKYFTFDVEGLTIGQQNSAYKIVIDNDRYTMYVNDREILWIDSKTEEVHTPNLSVTDQFKMLGYKVGNETNDVNETIDWEFIGGV